MQAPSISCLLCRQRKVRCDKGVPSCTRCLDSRVDCIYHDPKPPRRRRRRTPESVRKYRVEQSVSKNGSTAASSGTGSTNPAGYTSNEALFRAPSVTSWNLTRESPMRGLQGYQSSSDSEDEDEDETSALPATRSDRLLLGVTTSRSVVDLPEPQELERLWSVFLKNVDPFLKFTHVPSTDATLRAASFDCSLMAKPMRALLLCIALSAVSSEIFTPFDEGNEWRSLRFSRFQSLAADALIEAGYLRCFDLAVLQAFTIYLHAIKPACGPGTLWPVTGVAVRIGQKLGIHSEGTLCEKSVFEAEMCRRLWHSISFLDSTIGYLAGLQATQTTPSLKFPLNVNDSKIYPGMDELPAEEEGATEMMLVLIRCHLREYVRNIIGLRPILPGDDPEEEYPDKIRKKLKDLQDLIETKYLRYCDPLEPLHTIVNLATRSALCSVRIRLSHPNKVVAYDDNKEPVYSDDFLDLCIKSLEYENTLNSTTSLRGYLWNFSAHISVNGMAYLFTGLRTRPEGDLSDRAWNQVEQTYSNRPCLFSKTPDSLYHGLGVLALMAWDRRQQAKSGKIQEPSFITKLRKINRKRGPSKTFAGLVINDQALASNEVAGTSNEQATRSDQMVPEHPNFASEPVNWEHWNSALMDYQMGNGGDVYLNSIWDL